MSTDERRKALVEATRPLLLEHGANVSTRQIAEAAGVAEGTIFRAFSSKEELIHACVVDALAEDTLSRQLSTIDDRGDLAATAAATIRILAARIVDIRALVALLHDGVGFRPDQHDHTDHDHGPHERCQRPDPAAIRDAVLDAVATTLAPHADALRVEPRDAASVLIALTFGATHEFSGGDRLPDTDRLADLLLHGISKDA